MNKKITFLILLSILIYGASHFFAGNLSVKEENVQSNSVNNQKNEKQAVQQKIIQSNWVSELENMDTLKTHFSSTQEFETWYKLLGQLDKNQVLAGTVALCLPEFTDIALRNGGDIHTQIITCENDSSDAYLLAFSSTEEDNTQRLEKVKHICGKINDFVPLIYPDCCEQCLCDTFPYSSYPVYSSENFTSLLDYSLIKCYANMTDVLSKHGAQINQTTKLSQIDDIDIIQSLFNNGLDINVGGKELLFSNLCKKDSSDEKLLKMLVDRGVDINAVDDNGDTPLAKALDCRNLVSIKFLIAAGAHFNEKEKEILDKQCQKSFDPHFCALHPDGINHFFGPDNFAGANWVKSNKDRCSSEISKLFDAGVDPFVDFYGAPLIISLLNHVTIRSSSPAHVVKATQVKETKSLFSKFKKGARNKEEQSKEAPAKQKFTLFKCLKPQLDKIGLNSPANGFRSILFNAIHIDYIFAVETLLDNGADVHIKDENGNTPLLYALKKDKPNKSIVWLLIKNGSNIHSTNNAKESTLSYIIKSHLSKNANMEWLWPVFLKLHAKNKKEAEIVTYEEILSLITNVVEAELFNNNDKNKILQKETQLLDTLCLQDVLFYHIFKIQELSAQADKLEKNLYGLKQKESYLPLFDWIKKELIKESEIIKHLYKSDED